MAAVGSCIPECTGDGGGAGGDGHASPPSLPPATAERGGAATRSAGRIVTGTLGRRSLAERLTRPLVSAGPGSAVQRGFWVAVAVFLPMRVVADEGLAEDIIDMLHSAYAAVWSVRLVAGIRPAQGGELAELAEEKKAGAQEFFGRSIGYFLADFCYVLVQLARRRVPHLAAGRLVHHIVQGAANFPAILGCHRQTTAACSYLSVAYLAEISNLFLRTNNLLKRVGALKHPLWVGNFRLLLATFFLTRIVNFPFCTLLIWRHRAALPAVVFRGQITFAAVGMVLNLEWFRRLLGIYLRAARQRAAVMELL